MKARTIGKDIIESNLSKEESYNSRDAMAKTVYDKLFNWIVKRIN
jgi:myosin heavy subunit